MRSWTDAMGTESTSSRSTARSCSARAGYCWSAPRSQFSRLAVRRSARRRGIATALLQAADEETIAAGGKRIVLHAQTYARRLYENAGYRPRGRVFTEAGIEHIAMEKHL